MAIDDDSQSDEDTISRTHVNNRSGLLTAILFLLFLYTLSVASQILIPITLALLFSLLLSPMVKHLEAFHVPTAIGSMIAVVLVSFTLGYGIYALLEPAALWMEEAPSALRQLESNMAAVRAPLEEMQEAAEEIQEVAESVGEIAGGYNGAEVIEVRTERPGVSDWILAVAPATLAGIATILVLVYFMLASGDRFLRRTVEQISSFEDKKAAVLTVRTIQDSLSRYLYTISMINVGLGVVTALLLKYLDVPNPVLWGVLAGVLNFAPYVGPLMMTGVLIFVGLTSFDKIGIALVPAAAFFVLTTIEGQLITPTIAGRRLELNPVAIILTIIFLGWIWGIAGVLMAVPILVCIKIICENFESLHPISVFMERYSV